MNVAELLLKTHAVTLRTDPPYTWTSGILSPIYTDNRILMSYPLERRKIIDAFANAIKENELEFDTIAGVSTSGIPWAAWLAEGLNKPMVYVRKAAKGHGKENAIEGKVEKGEKVLVIEDLISTGGSSVAVVEALRTAECKVVACVAIFNYELKKGIDKFKKADCNLISLTNFSTLIELAAEQGYIKEDEKQKVLEWSKDPETWGR
ncbi:MAG: orotate phosphoribosyltransferase [bacterium]|nr:orotate phosphoribosyltransferase [bacterium]